MTEHDQSSTAINVQMETVAVPAEAAEVATFLHALANRIEAGQGEEVLIGLWNTGHGEAWEWTFQVVIDRPGENGSEETDR